MSADYKVKLEYPIKIDDTEVTYLSIRRPKVIDLKVANKASNDPAEREIQLFANLCQVAPADLEKLDLADYTALQEKLSSFLERSVSKI